MGTRNVVLTEAQSELVDRLVARLLGSGAECVIAAAPIADTLKRAGEGDAVDATIDRAGLWGAQTPQVFRTTALRRAQDAARESGHLKIATDEAWLIERVGETVLLEAAGAPNLKVTEPADLAVAEAQRRIWPARRTLTVHPGVDLELFDPALYPDARASRERLGLSPDARPDMLQG